MKDDKLAEATRISRAIRNKTAEEILMDVAIETIKERVEVEARFNSKLMRRK